MRALLLSVVLLSSAPLTAQGSPVDVVLYYSRHDPAGGQLKKVLLDWDGTTLSLGAPKLLAVIPRIDGLAFAPDGDVVCGSQQLEMYKVDPTTGRYVWTRVGQSIFHVTVEPGGQKAWAGGRPGLLTQVALEPFGATSTHFLGGDDNQVTMLAFVGNDVYYTTSGLGGIGQFGTIDLSTFTTTRLLANQPAAHGIAVDPVTNQIFLFGNQHIVQIQPDPVNPVVLATLDLTGSVTVLDQGAVDGAGHAFVTDAGTGNLVFLDYSGSGLIDDPSTLVRTAFVDSNLKSFAPLSGPGRRAARWSNYGIGWPGTQGVPSLTLDAMPVFATTSNIVLQNSSGVDASGCIGFSLVPASGQSPLGGSFLIGPATAVYTLLVPAGGASVPMHVPSVAAWPCGLTLYAQGFQLDVGATHRVSFSPGIQIVPGL